MDVSYDLVRSKKFFFLSLEDLGEIGHIGGFDQHYNRRRRGHAEQLVLGRGGCGGGGGSSSSSVGGGGGGIRVVQRWRLGAGGDRNGWPARFEEGQDIDGGDQSGGGGQGQGRSSTNGRAQSRRRREALRRRRQPLTAGGGRNAWPGCR